MLLIVIILLAIASMLTIFGFVVLFGLIWDSTREKRQKYVERR